MMVARIHDMRTTVAGSAIIRRRGFLREGDLGPREDWLTMEDGRPRKGGIGLQAAIEVLKEGVIGLVCLGAILGAILANVNPGITVRTTQRPERGNTRQILARGVRIRVGDPSRKDEPARVMILWGG
jgi:hypothetical protein